jgi:hypothetical protein
VSAAYVCAFFYSAGLEVVALLRAGNAVLFLEILFGVDSTNVLLIRLYGTE